MTMLKAPVLPIWPPPLEVREKLRPQCEADGVTQNFCVTRINNNIPLCVGCVDRSWMVGPLGVQNSPNLLLTQQGKGTAIVRAFLLICSCANNHLIRVPA